MTARKDTVSADHVLKTYMRDNEHFADLMNAGLLNGEDRFQPSRLLPGDAEITAALRREQDVVDVGRIRDLTRIYVEGNGDVAACAIVAIENQMEIHHAMAPRVMMSTAADYWSQVKTHAMRHEQARKDDKEKGGSGADFLSRIQPTDYLIPVITLVVYFGTEPWTAPLEISGMFAPGTEPFIRRLSGNFRYHLFCASNHQTTFRNTDNEALFSAAKIVAAPGLSRDERAEKIYNALSKGSPTVWETFQALYGGKTLVRKLRDAVEKKVMIENIGTEIDREIENAQKEAENQRNRADEALKQAAAERKRAEELERSDHAMREYIKSLGVDPDEVIGAQA